MPLSSGDITAILALREPRVCAYWCDAKYLETQELRSKIEVEAKGISSTFSPLINPIFNRGENQMTITSVSKICLVDGCNKPAIKLGRCDTDYHRFRRTPEYRRKLNRGDGQNPTERFWSRVTRTTDDACWEWQGTTCLGYGHVSFLGKLQKAHRVAWYLTHGKFPEQYLLHSCDNRKCVNPQHLREGSQQENMNDMKTRMRQARGQDTGVAVLNIQKVREIRQMRARSMSYRAIAEVIGVGATTVRQVIARKTWAYVD